eukprot:TRINITY_DN2708_c0_g1_i7.p1 TRINITY_DN2708_c0_g1~~TRINITY_DN2708_c0_g1_i7.p1  ORF type:complete len:310 (-),score=15.65 TRINITY_DN2708_c0_g1_i7:69-998(-)
MKLSHKYYEATQDSSFITSEWIQAVNVILDVFTQLMQGTDEELSKGAPIYTFSREVSMPLDTLLHSIGAPCRRTGLVKQYFRPSDDACTFPFNIPANAFISVSLQQIGSLLQKLQLSKELSNQCIKMAKSINESIYQHGITEDSKGQKYFVYEVDGYGNKLFMDDANIPSLLSLPYLGFIDQEDPIYLATRKKLLSVENQYYFKGKILKGIGSPHIIEPERRSYVWPMSLVVQALTTKNEDEIIDCLQMILKSTNGTYFMHESVHKDDPSKFTRSWFAWANSIFGELILHLYEIKSTSLNYNFDKDLTQ